MSSISASAARPVTYSSFSGRRSTTGRWSMFRGSRRGVASDLVSCRRGTAPFLVEHLAGTSGRATSSSFSGRRNMTGRGQRLADSRPQGHGVGHQWRDPHAPSMSSISTAGRQRATCSSSGGRRNMTGRLWTHRTRTRVASHPRSRAGSPPTARCWSSTLPRTMQTGAARLLVVDGPRLAIDRTCQRSTGRKVAGPPTAWVTGPVEHLAARTMTAR